ncbi:hypothetical protein [Streptomyces huiliensis]|uniref:hypothetical protein n=1 Tax=Streptomyces huiliensis TaxID=2876027 RepID=UPI001CBC2EB2|nr:hypothetical protein [Streptomyces huiliensis]MBZ4321817.1 hypothetical protein [Streptomyces huiliensis]
MPTVREPGEGGGVEIRSYLRRLRPWQTLAAAVVTAVLALIGTLIDSSPGGGPAEPRADASPVVRESTPALSLGIVSVTERTVGPDTREVEFVGRVSGLPEHWNVYVLVENPDPDLPRPAGPGSSPGPTARPAGGGWLVSPSAAVDKAGRWTVRWRVAGLPAEVTWRAVVFDNGCDRGGRCSAAPAPPRSSSHPLADVGPAAQGVRATATYR